MKILLVGIGRRSTHWVVRSGPFVVSLLCIAFVFGTLVALGASTASTALDRSSQMTLMYAGIAGAVCAVVAWLQADRRQRRRLADIDALAKEHLDSIQEQRVELEAAVDGLLTETARRRDAAQRPHAA